MTREAGKMSIKLLSFYRGRKAREREAGDGFRELTSKSVRLS